jgi:hypothetical protein
MFDRRVIWILVIILLVIVLWWALDHVLFPTLPMPAGVAPISK